MKNGEMVNNCRVESFMGDQITIEILSLVTVVNLYACSSSGHYTVKKKACNAHQIWCATFVPSGTPYMA